MAHFSDAQEVYDRIGRTLAEAVADEELGPRLRSADTVVQYRFRAPDSQVTIRLRPEADGIVELGPTGLVPEVIIGMDADNGHRYWSGELNPTVALAKGQMATKGSVSKILRLLPLVQPVFERYRALEGAEPAAAAGEDAGADPAAEGEQG